MIIKTKKFQLPTGTFIRTGLSGVLKQQWWVLIIVVALMGMNFVLPNIWWIIGTLIAYILYILFWLIQFAGVTQMEQGKFLFERLSYEISSQQILVKVNTKQGMPIKWNQIKRAKLGKDHFILFMSKVQFFYWPHKIFNTENERKFLKSILERKGLVKNK